MPENGDLFRAIFDDGANHMAEAGDVDGAYLGALLDNDSNRLAGQARFMPVDEGEGERSPAENNDEDAAILLVAVAAAALAAGVLGTIAVMKNAPRLKTWWNDDVAPALIKRLPRKARIVQPQPPSTSPVVSALSNSGPTEFSRAIDEAFEQHRVTMSSEDASKRLLAIFAAAAFIAEQMRQLASAEIVEGGHRAELEAALAKLTPQAVTDGINMILERDAQLLDGASAAEYMRFFGGGQAVDGVYVPLTNRRVREAMRLDDGDEDGDSSVLA
ncbi:hypothetical protein [uncultured Frigoribacterium sp.]|uniref:hypothetical protein n=1 Tax=uncultured Frigoribacterium sp. TaxID=335377 RepID=UPI0028D09E82|nr:hypothetical protein [uncultured Frigoribacterium sp.]